MRDKILAIDPSVRLLGWAVVTTTRATNPHSIVSCGYIKQTTEDVSYQRRCVLMALEVIKTVDQFAAHLTGIIIELPTYRSGSLGQRSLDSESIQRLYWQTGAIYGALTMYSIPVHGVSAHQWKGQAPKSVMIERSWKYLQASGVSRSPHNAKIPHDTHEAICLAYFYLKGSEHIHTVNDCTSTIGKFTHQSFC